MQSNNKFTPRLRLAIQIAIQMAEDNEQPGVYYPHLICGILDAGHTFLSKYLKKRGVDIFAPEVIEKFEDLAKDPELLKLRFNPKSNWAPLHEHIYKDCFEYASKFMVGDMLGPEHVLLGILANYDAFKLWLTTFGINHEALEAALKSFVSKSSDNRQIPDEELDLVPSGVDDGDTGVPDDPVEAYCESVIGRVVRDDIIVFGRDKQIQSIIETLGRKTKSNAILLGPAGVGKTAIVNGLAKEIFCGDVPGTLLNHLVYELNVSSLISGTKYRGQFEERITVLLEELKKRGNVILFIDEIHAIVGAGNSEGHLDIANVLKPALADGSIKCIGATTEDEYRKFFSKDEALSRRFEPILVPEPSLSETIDILEASKSSYEKFHNVSVSKNIVADIVTLCHKFITGRRFPDKAFDVMDQACSKTKQRIYKLPKSISQISKTLYEQASSGDDIDESLSEKLEKKYESFMEKKSKSKTRLYRDDIIDVVASKSGVGKDVVESSSVIDIEKDLSLSLFGQNSVVESASNVISASLAGVSFSDGPTCSFFCYGAKGSGKTYFGEVVNSIIHHRKDSVLLLRMSEYTHESTVSKLVGTSAGYIGHKEGGVLTNFVSVHPNSVIIFDRIEEASPQVVGIISSILSFGKITDSSNREVDFSKTIIVITSNDGSSSSSSIGFVSSDNSFGDIGNMFPISNDVDAVLKFSPLSDDVLMRIINQRLSKTVASIKKTGVSIHVDASVVRYIFDCIDSDKGAVGIDKTVKALFDSGVGKFVLRNPDAKSVYALSDSSSISFSQDKPSSFLRYSHAKISSKKQVIFD